MHGYHSVYGFGMVLKMNFTAERVFLQFDSENENTTVVAGWFAFADVYTVEYTPPPRVA